MHCDVCDHWNDEEESHCEVCDHPLNEFSGEFYDEDDFSFYDNEEDHY
ncbi:hypothetical protein PSPHG_CDS_0078 [Pseudomonas phage Psxphi15]